MALEAICGEQTLAELATKHGIQGRLTSAGGVNDYNTERPHSPFGSAIPAAFIVWLEQQRAG